MNANEPQMVHCPNRGEILPQKCTRDRSSGREACAKCPIFIVCPECGDELTMILSNADTGGRWGCKDSACGWKSEYLPWNVAKSLAKDMGSRIPLGAPSPKADRAPEPTKPTPEPAPIPEQPPIPMSLVTKAAKPSNYVTLTIRVTGEAAAVFGVLSEVAEVAEVEVLGAGDESG